MNNRALPEGGCIVLIVAVIFIAVLGLGVNSCVRSLHKENVTFTVQDKWVKRSSGNKDTYLVGTDRGVYKISDDFIHLKFDSSDVYLGLRVGRKYDCTVYGYRQHLFSQYQNIDHCTQVQN